VGKGCLAIPQEMGDLPEMVVSQNTTGLIPSLCRRGSGGRGNSVSKAGLFLSVGALGISLRSSQRDHDFRAEIIYASGALHYHHWKPVNTPKRCHSFQSRESGNPFLHLRPISAQPIQGGLDLPKSEMHTALIYVYRDEIVRRIIQLKGFMATAFRSQQYP